jgi:hypothetical protein
MSKLFRILGINRKIMASKTYYIYEIPGVKIGCTDNVKKRIKKQGYTNYTILETHTDIHQASQREIELQKHYGYRVDTKPYWKTIKMASSGGKIGGKKNKESGHMSNIGKKYGKINGKKNVESGHIVALGKIIGKKNVESGQLASIASLGGKTQGKKNKESGHIADLGKKYGKIAGKKAVESGQIAALGKLKRKLTFEQAEEIREKFTKMDGGKLVRYDTLAFEYNVSQSVIWSIIKNKTYTEQ